MYSKTKKMVIIWKFIILFCIIVTVLKLLPKLPNQIKMIIFIIGVGVIALFFLPFMVFRPRDSRNCNGPTWVCKYFGKALGITMEVRGLENIRIDHGSIIIMNHQSAYDLIAIAHLWPLLGKITTVAKKELIYIPFFGLGLWFSGFLFIDRSKRIDSIRSLNKESKAIQDENYKLLVFPEGTRNSTNTLLPFKKGSFHIAIQSQCPIQPVITSHFSFIYNKRIKISHAIINILPEIYTNNYNKDNINELVNYCQNTMQIEYDKLNKEIQIMNNIKEL